MQRAVGQPLQIAVALHYLANLARQQGNGPLARSQHQESLLLFRALGEGYWLEQALRTIALLLKQATRLVAAGRLLGAAEALRQTLGIPIPPRELASYEQTVATLRTELGDEVFTTAWAAGRVMTLTQALDDALTEFE